MPRAGIALGSNLGPRLANLQAAREWLSRLSRPGTALLQAPVYQTSPLACPDGSPDFFNTVVEIDYDGSPAELLQQTQAIEMTLGRNRGTTRHAGSRPAALAGSTQGPSDDRFVPHALPP